MEINKIRKNIFLFPLLFLVSIVYRIITDIRNLLYNTGLFKIQIFDVPVINVGNITAGGTGKTPFILYLLEKLHGFYNNIVVVSRGYGRQSKGLQIVSDGNGKIISPDIGGDEPVLIAQKFQNIPVIVSEDRRKGIECAINQFKTDLVLLDDAFQHRKVHRNCDIVLVDANYPVREERLMPLGNLREKKSNLKRADFIMITKIDDLDSKTEQVNYYKTFAAHLYLSKFKILNIWEINSNSEKDIVDLKRNSFIAFSGIANPDSFKSDLEKYGLNLKDFIPFSDHKKYRKKDIDKINNKSDYHKCNNFITTEKDFVKLNMKDFKNYKLFVSSMKIEVIDEEFFLKKVQDCIDSK